MSNSMVRAMNSERHVNAKKMSYSKSCTIIVESETDVSVYRKFFKDKPIELKPANGYEGVIETVVEKGSCIDSIIGIIDADFTHITGKKRTDCEKIFLTDYHDVETTLLSLFDMTTYLENGEIKKVRGEDPLTKARKISYEIGLCRYINNKDNDDRFSLRFRHNDKKLPYTNKKSGIYNGKVLDSVIDFNMQHNPKFYENGFEENERELRKTYDEYIDKKLDELQIINGHDFLPIFMKLFVESIKYLNNMNEKEFLMFIVRQVDGLIFAKTNLYKQIIDYMDKKRIN